MDFEEFLKANNKELLIDAIKNSFNKNKSIGKEIHEKILNYYRRYLLSGGMPESVKKTIECDNDYYNYDVNILKNIIEDYKNDMNNHVTNTAETLKIRKIYSSLPSQLSNISKKFQYSTIDSNAKSREYLLPLNWLEESNMIQICKCVKRPEKPLKGFIDEETFKAYFSDVGIFNQIIDNDIKSIILDEMKIYKGIITENYVANQLKSSGIDLLYWKGPRNSKIDFLISTTNDEIKPEIEENNKTIKKEEKIIEDSIEDIAEKIFSNDKIEIE